MTVDRFGIHDKVEITVLSLGDNFEAGDYEFIKLPGILRDEGECRSVDEGACEKIGGRCHRVPLIGRNSVPRL